MMKIQVIDFLFYYYSIYEFFSALHKNASKQLPLILPVALKLMMKKTTPKKCKQH